MRTRANYLRVAAGTVAVVALLPAHSLFASTGATGATGLPDTTNGLHFFLPFNSTIPVVNGSRSGEAPADYTWGASTNGTGNVPGAAPWHEKYSAWQRENRDNQDSLAWYQANHPDWIMYAADKTTPAGYGAYYNYQDHSDVALDYTNPAVQQYVAAWWESRLAAGYQGISIDNGITDNNTNAVGHYDLNHTWIAQYTGKEPGDAAFTAASDQALANIVGMVKAKYPNASITVNHAYNCSWDTQADYEAELPSVTMMLDESELQLWETNGSCSKAGGSEWLTTMREYQHIQKDLGKGFADDTNVGYSVAPYMTDTNLPARADLQWRLANYLLIKYSHTYFWWGAESQYGQPLQMQHEYSAPIGSPTDDFYAAQNVYMRDFTNGLAVVNPDSAAAHTISFPAGKYKDLYGNSFTSISMAPKSGLILLLAGTPVAAPSSTIVPITAPSATAAPATATVAPATATPASPAVVGGGVALDQASHSATQGSAAALTWTHTVGAAPNRLLLVGVSSRTLPGGVHAVAGVTDNGVAMTPVGPALHNYGTYLDLYALANPPSGGNAIAVKLSAADQVIAGATSFSNVSQASPLGAAASGTAYAGTVSATAATAAADTVVSVLSVDADGAYAPGSGQAQRWQANSAAGWYNTAAMGTLPAQAGAATPSWSGIGASDDAAEIAVPVHAAAS